MSISRRAARVCAAGVVLAVFGVLNAPLHAHAPSAGPPDAPGSGARIVATTNADGSLSVDYGRLDRTALVQRLDPRAGVLGSLDVTRAELKRELGIDLPDLHPQSRLADVGPQPQPQPEPVPEPQAEPVAVEGVAGWASPAYDLSGDGADDALVFEFDLASERIIAMRAVDGRSGAGLWRLGVEELGDALAIPAVDMTGDGRADVIVLKVVLLERTHSESCDTAGNCTSESLETFRWTRALLSGASGGVVWSDSVDGSWRYHTTGSSTGDAVRSSESFTETIETVNYIVDAFPGGDYDGDGLPDLVTDDVDIRAEYSEERASGALLFSSWSTTDSLRAATRALVRSGKDGATLSSHTSEDSPIVAALLPTRDLVGDESLDLLWSGYEYDDFEVACESVSLVVTRLDDCESTDYGKRLVIKAIDGETLDEAWTSRGPNVFISFYLDAPDVSGDGTQDLLRVELDAVTDDMSTVVISGADGADLFRMSGYPMLSGVVLSGAAPTGIVVAEMYLDGNQDPMVRVDRWDGATRALLSSTVTPISTGIEDPQFRSYNLYAAGDVGGTPAPDLLTSVAEADFDGDEVRAQASTWRIEDGGGAVLSQGRADGRMRLLAPLADLNGDRAFEALDYDLVVEIDSSEGSLYSRRVNRGIQALADDMRLWSLADDDDGLSLAGNQDGEAGQEVFVHRQTVSPEGLRGTAISSLDGGTGAVRWTITT